MLEVLAAKLPDAPINLADEPAGTNAYQIGISWDEGPYNGGSEVLDYRVSFTELSANNFEVFSSNVVVKTETVTGLTPGLTYRFKVEARNIISYSEFSSHVDILAAQIPDAPTDLADVPEITDADEIGLSWVAPLFDGGSPLIDYRLWMDDSQGGGFVV